MKFAKSMYLGGDIVSPADCDRDSYSEFGLICPFCSNAVFLRKASTRQLKTKLIDIPATFSHFPNVASVDCEAYSITNKGLQQLTIQRQQAKQQRLQIYQNNLWDLLKTNKSDITKEYLSYIETQYTSKFIKSVINKQLELFKNIPKSRYSDTFYESYIKTIINNSNYSVLTSIQTNDIQSNIIKYFSSFDKELHKSISFEIFEFLTTKSGLHIFKKIVTFTLGMPELKNNTSKTQNHHELIFDVIFYFVISTPLLDIFK